jgi:hypothetical protein
MHAVNFFHTRRLRVPRSFDVDKAIAYIDKILERGEDSEQDISIFIAIRAVLMEARTP